MTTRIRWSAALAALVLVASAAFALTRPGAHSSASAASADAQLSVVGASSTAPKVTDSTIQSEVASAVDNGTRGGATADVASARLALQTSTGIKVLAVPATGQTCAVVELPGSLGQGAMHCVSNAEFNTSGAWQMVGAPPSVDVVGLVPDGVTSVNVTFVDGTSRTATVTNNAFDIQSKVASASISFTTPAGNYSGPAQSAG